MNLTSSRPIQLRQVRQNNLKGIDVDFPEKKITVVTGVSGSGKSSLVFDTLYAEGQRRYIESLSTYTRQFLQKMPKPDLDSVKNIPPAIALEQHNHVLSSRSTVGTQSEVLDYLRLLFAKAGTTFCVSCGDEVQKMTAQSILDWLLKEKKGLKNLILAPLTFEDTSEPAKKKNSRKKGLTKKTSTKSQSPKIPSPESILTLLAEQGFQRLALHSGKPRMKLELHDLEDLRGLNKKQLVELFKDKLLYVVIDRVGFEEVDSDLCARVLDSIDQALALGKNRVAFSDLDHLGQISTFETRFICRSCSREHRVPEPSLFSYSNPLGACKNCSGFGYTLNLDESLVVPDPSKTLKNGAIDPFSKPSFQDWQKDLFRFAERHGISIGKRYQELTASQKKLLWEGDERDPVFPGIHACFEELKRWKYKIHVRVFIRRYQNQTLCTQCQGARLNPEALAVRIENSNLSDIFSLSVENALKWIEKLKLKAHHEKAAHELVDQLKNRLTLLNEVGVGYLSLSRMTKTLSGGEFQRISLATQIGNGLCGTLYVLDEPSIGLHAADTHRLIQIIYRLRNQGNTVVVVEHDVDMMKAADWLMELGPQAGHLGGHLVAQGTLEAISRNSDSITGKYLSGQNSLKRTSSERPPHKRSIHLMGCSEHNLKSIDVEFPLDRLVVVTGVSGSGKSTLVHKTLYRAIAQTFGQTQDKPGRFEKIYGVDQISSVALLDQSPIGKSSRSNPATYLKAWDEIRRIYASQVLSLKRGYTPAHFSFNVDGGRCPVCKGEGEILLDMHFMAEVRLPCEECNGKRFKKSTLDVSYRGKNVHQLLHTTINEAFEIFRDHPALAKKLGTLRDVGLGYLQLGQSATTLSGGESQRLKIALTLDQKSKGNTLYIFDEPTTGLHLEDVKRLISVLHDLVDSKNSVILIEHHLDVIAHADWVIDLGPGGGHAGGDLLAQGSPAQLADSPQSITGHFLKEEFPELLKNRSASDLYS